MATDRKKKQPPYRVSVRPANVSEEEAETRLTAAFDILFDEVFRRRGEKLEQSRPPQT